MEDIDIDEPVGEGVPEGYQHSNSEEMPVRYTKTGDAAGIDGAASGSGGVSHNPFGYGKTAVTCGPNVGYGGGGGGGKPYWDNSTVSLNGVSGGGGGGISGNPFGYAEHKDTAIAMTYMPMSDLLGGTQVFMERAGQLDSYPFPYEPSEQLQEFRQRILNEEIREWFDAVENDDLVEQLDALLDIIVVAWGTALAYLGPTVAKAAAREVVASNLAKVIGTQIDPETGEETPLPIKRHDGKVMKPIGWQPPDIEGVLERYDTSEEFSKVKTTDAKPVSNNRNQGKQHD